MAFPRPLTAASLIEDHRLSHRKSDAEDRRKIFNLTKDSQGSRSYPTSPSSAHEKPNRKSRPSTCSTGRSAKSSPINPKCFFKSKIAPSSGSLKSVHKSDESIEITSISEDEENEVKPNYATHSPAGKSVIYNGFTSNEKDKQLLEWSSQMTLVPERIRQIASNLSRRTGLVKELIILPPTPSTGTSDKEDVEAPGPPPLKQDIKTLALVEDVEKSDETKVEVKQGTLRRMLKALRAAVTFPKTLDPRSRLNITWLFITCCSFFYNAWMVPMRSVFSHFQTEENLHMWFALDYSCDAIYVIDMILFKPRIQFLKDGSWVMEAKQIRTTYLKSHRFALDLVSLLPLDLLYLYYGPISAFRFPRLFKVYIFWEFFDKIDAVLSNPFIARLSRTVLYMVYTIHLNALVYYGFSKYEGIGSNKWVFQGHGNAYVRCYYFAIKTATSIGKNPKPENVHEQALMTVCWLAGVFVFAVLIGQVKDIVLTAARNQDEYMRVRDQTLDYLNKFNVPQSTMDRVRLWFSYTWKTQKTLDEIYPLRFLPIKLQMDLAINVHIQTLNKVELFRDCDENLLRDLVLKLKPVIYLPGDFVCKKGEVGKEMYIVKNGEVQVVGGPNGDIVFATLGEGSVFGEISLLALAGGNRRTADVRSHGFSNLFVLSKEDLQITIKDHPEAQKVLKRKAAKLIKDTKSREKSPSKEECETKPKRTNNPKLLDAVIKAAPRGSLPETLLLLSAKIRASQDVSNELGPEDEASQTTADRTLQQGSSEDEILVVESVLVNRGQESDEDAEMDVEEPSNNVDGSTNTDVTEECETYDANENLEDTVDDVCLSIVEKVGEEYDEWVQGIYGNPQDSITILQSLNENIHLIPVKERVTYSFAQHQLKFPLNFCKNKSTIQLADDEYLELANTQDEMQNDDDTLSTNSDPRPHQIPYDPLHLKANCQNDNDFRKLRKESSSLNDFFDEPNGNNSKPVKEEKVKSEQCSKRKGIIDFGSPRGSDDWSMYGFDSPRSDNGDIMDPVSNRIRPVLSFGSLSSRDSFDLPTFITKIPSLSSESELNRDHSPSPKVYSRFLKRKKTSN